MNMKYTYEDGIVLSRTTARRFRYTANVSVCVSCSSSIPNKGDSVEAYSKPWWQNHFGGKVVSVSSGPQDTIRLEIYCECLPVNGDKFTTLHGQKGVVTILDDREMPVVADVCAEMVLGSSSVIKRQTVSQLLEAAYSMHRKVHMAGSDTKLYADVEEDYRMKYRHARNNITDILCRYEGDVHMFGSPIRRLRHTVGSGIAAPCNVRANYGIIRLMQSSFLASFRMSSTHNLASVFRVRPETSSSQGGSRSLGEMETMQLLASGMTHSLKEFSISSIFVA